MLALAYEQKKRALRGFVLLETVKVLGEVIDAVREKGNLHFGRAAVFVGFAVRFCEFLFEFFGYWHCCQFVRKPFFRVIFIFCF